MKTLITTAMLGFVCVLFSGCQTPQERAMSQMERQMRAQVKMMERMEKVMADLEKQM